MGTMVDGKFVPRFGPLALPGWRNRKGTQVTDTKAYTEGGISRAMTPKELEAEKKKRGAAGQTAFETLGGD